MTITTDSFPPKAKLKSNKGSTLFEILIVMLLIGILAAIIIPKVFHKAQRTDLNTAKASVLNLLKIAQSSAIIEHAPSDMKQKVRFLIHIDPNFKDQYCATMLLIQGERTHWKILQPLMQLPISVFFVKPTGDLLQTMDFDPVNVADGQGPTWLYYEFDAKGHYTGVLNRICLNEGELEEQDGRAHIVYKKNQDHSCIYINPTGFAHDVQK